MIWGYHYCWKHPYFIIFVRWCVFPLFQSYTAQCAEITLVPYWEVVTLCKMLIDAFSRHSTKSNGTVILLLGCWSKNLAVGSELNPISNDSFLAGGFTYLLFSPLPRGNDHIWLAQIFHKWVGSTTNSFFCESLDVVSYWQTKRDRE